MMSSSTNGCRTACAFPPRAVRSTAVARRISRSTSNIPSRPRSIAICGQHLKAALGGCTLSSGGDPPGGGQWQAVTGGGRAQVRLLRRLLSTLSADADQRSRTFETSRFGSGQELQRPHKAEFPEAGGQRSAEQPATLAGGGQDREEDPALLSAGRQGLGTAG